ncbi:hypothetical protein SLH46_11190 [Draconibacterium sp. IB214405]|uniref:hypothetical protein n=1 Tax=Draconibacterium sp. IB214405 TaxID=3097352 RepID=UPI002A0BF3A2|nr:hypothetical protein [Draconibacterium sp. IB214405]MDX8339751.1 hypothetical protein [Draconibacterium sp. IB214405]
MKKLRIITPYLIFLFVTISFTYLLISNSRYKNQLRVSEQNHTSLRIQKEILIDFAISHLKQKCSLPENIAAINESGSLTDVLDLIISGDNIILCFDNKACMDCVSNQVNLLEENYPNFNLYFLTNDISYEKVNRYVQIIDKNIILLCTEELNAEFEVYSPFFLFYDENKDSLNKFFSVKEIPELTLAILNSIFES